MTTPTTDPHKLRVIVVGGGVAALETALALHELAPQQTAVSVIAPNDEFMYRPMTVCEPFAYGTAKRYPLAPIVAGAGAELIVDQLASIDPDRRVVHLGDGDERAYDALVLALGAKTHARYEHATTIDASSMDTMLHGLIQDIEGGYVHSLALVAPGRMAWPLPLYELALMTAARAYDMNVELQTTIVTPEDTPLAVFGAEASGAVSRLLAAARVETITSAYAEIPAMGQLAINPGDRRLAVDRVIALPELFGPDVRGIPLGEHGFIHVDRFGAVSDCERVYAAGDATDFPIKQGGLAAQQADVVAQAIAALAGAAVTPDQFDPTLQGMLLTGASPIYLSARITGGRGSHSQFSDKPLWSPPVKIAARYLAPYLAGADREPSASAA